MLFFTFPSYLAVTSNMTLVQVATSNTGIIHVLLPGTTLIELHYWVTIWSVLPTLHLDCLGGKYFTLAFTPFSSEAVWTCLNSTCAITNIISPRDSKTVPPNTTSYSAMSKSLSLPYLSNPPRTSTVDQTMDLINVTLHQIQQNAEMLDQLQCQTSLTILPMLTT